MIIEANQKRILFEEAARKGLRGGDLYSVGEIYSRLIAESDLRNQFYGESLTPFYEAKEGYEIDVKRIKAFFDGIVRDLKVLDFSESELEDQLLAINLEFWNKAQFIKNRATKIQKIANQERFRAAFQATWLYSDSFNDINGTDLKRSTIAFDSAEGIIFIPLISSTQSITNKDFTLENLSLPTLGNTLGSQLAQAFDGLPGTSFRCLFVDNSQCSFELKLNSTQNLIQVSIDPVGFGINLIISAWVSGKWEEKVNSVIYNRTSFPLSVTTDKIKVSFSVAENSYPKAGGLREFNLFNETFSDRAEFYSTVLKPEGSFKEIKVDYSGKQLGQDLVSFSYALTSGGPWVSLQKNTWALVNANSIIDKAIDFTQNQPHQNLGGLYESSSLPGFNANVYSGVLQVGQNQVEVLCSNNSTIDALDPFVTPTLQDFKGITKKAWSSIPRLAVSPNSRVFQNYNTTTLNSFGFKRAGQFLIASRLSSPTLAQNSDQKLYSSFILAPILGNGTNTIQNNYIYKLKFMVFAPERFYYGNGKAWFLQGYKVSGSKSYRDLGRTFGSYAIYLNGNLVVSENQPFTIYQDNSLETGGELGKSYSMTFEQGWNTYEIVLNTIDPSFYGEDSFTSENPYLQLEIFPNITDLKFMGSEVTKLSNVLASGEFKPSSEFDLMWDLPTDPTHWAWASSRDKILFNTNTLENIDGYYLGSIPNMNLKFSSITDLQNQDLYIRAILERNSQASPLIESYSVLVR